MRLSTRTLRELGEDLVLAPERWTVEEGSGAGIPLGELVVERRARAVDRAALVLDTTHARDGMLDLAAALRSREEAKSAKKLALSGDLLVSRLRPYLRQIAFVHPRALELAGRGLAVSTEYYVLAPPAGHSLAYLLPFLLAPRAQALLAAAQEGGHHPRVPREALLAIRIPEAVVAARVAIARRVNRAVAAAYDATAALQAALSLPDVPGAPDVTALAAARPDTRGRSPSSSRGGARSRGRAAGRA